MVIRKCIFPLRAALIMAAVLGDASAAAELPGHAHEPLAVDSTLTLTATVELALPAYPDSVVLAARAEQANAWTRRGGSLLREPASLILRYQSDRLGSDIGLEEYEAGFDLPLWVWGARSAIKTFGDALSAESAAASVALRWQVAGLVRMALWDVALAENDHELAEQALDTADRLARVVERRHELGDVALSDVLLARSSYLEFQTALIEADAALLDAERAFRSLTGLDRRPDFVPEVLSNADEVTAEHPALALANAAIVRAEADVTVVRKTANDGANVLIGSRRERSDLNLDLDDSIGILVSIPFGGSSHRDAQVSNAARAASQVKAARNRQLRTLTLALHEAAHGLNVVHQNIEASSERLELAERQQAMGESAYEKGEIELIDLLKLQATTIAARRQMTGLTIDEKRQTALYNQAVGELP